MAGDLAVVAVESSLGPELANACGGVCCSVWGCWVTARCASLCCATGGFVVRIRQVHSWWRVHQLQPQLAVRRHLAFTRQQQQHSSSTARHRALANTPPEPQLAEAIHRSSKVVVGGARGAVADRWTRLALRKDKSAHEVRRVYRRRHSSALVALEGALKVSQKPRAFKQNNFDLARVVGEKNHVI